MCEVGGGGREADMKFTHLSFSVAILESLSPHTGCSSGEIDWSQFCFDVN